jgi:hypothetical protein
MIDDVFNDEAEEKQPVEQSTEQQDPANQQVEPEAEQPAADAETTAAQNTEKHVPLAALEAERKGRQDWKEKAVRFEEEARQLRERMAERQTERPQQQMDPVQQLRQEMLNERFNMSEMVARQKYPDLDDVVKHFQEAVQANPALAMALQQNVNPYEFAYREGKRVQMLKEVGDDPAAYRAKIEAEIREQLSKPAAQQSLNLPGSLAGARSSASRTAPAFTGPQPLDSLFKN